MQPSVKEKNTCGRVQRRVIHLLAQAAESSLGNMTTDLLPQLSPQHKYHPAIKLLGCIAVDFCASAQCFCFAWTRDGRRLMLESKPKSELAIARFLSRGGGFCSSQGDASLKDVGLDSICPKHYNRTGQHSKTNKG